MKRTSVNSSNIRSIGYDIESQILEVEFKNDSIYQYFGVPSAVFNGLMNAESHGKYLNANIKNAGYRYERID